MAVTSASLMLDVDRPIDLGRRRKLVANEYKIFATYKRLNARIEYSLKKDSEMQL